MSRLFVLLLTVISAPALHAQWVDVESYPVLPGSAEPVAFNASGIGVGYYSIPSPSGSSSVRFGATSFVHLDAPAGLPYNGQTSLRGIDAQGVAYGGSQIDFFHSDATVWVATTPQLVASLVSSGASLDLHEAIGGLPSGAIVGTARLPGSTVVDRGFYLKGGILTELHDANLMSTAIPLGVGVVGGVDVVVGFGVVGSTTRAWTWAAGSFTLLPVPALPNVALAAQCINSAGTVGGWYSTTNDPLTTPAYPRAATWVNGTFVDLHNVSGQSTQVRAINAAGDAAGEANSGPDLAVVWLGTQGVLLQGLIPIGTLIFPERALSITDDGTIYGTDLLAGGFRMRLCAGNYQMLGGACGSFPVPVLEPGAGCPDAGQTMSLEISSGPANAIGLLLIGAGNGALSFKPTCTLGVAPLLPVTLPLAVSAAGAATIGGTLPATLPPTTFYLQVLLADPSAAAGAEASNVLRVDVH